MRGIKPHPDKKVDFPSPLIFKNISLEPVDGLQYRKMVLIRKKSWQEMNFKFFSEKTTFLSGWGLTPLMIKVDFFNALPWSTKFAVIEL